MHSGLKHVGLYSNYFPFCDNSCRIIWTMLNKFVQLWCIMCANIVVAQTRWQAYLLGEINLEAIIGVRAAQISQTKTTHKEVVKGLQSKIIGWGLIKLCFSVREVFNLTKILVRLLKPCSYLTTQFHVHNGIQVDYRARHLLFPQLGSRTTIKQ